MNLVKKILGSGAVLLLLISCSCTGPFLLPTQNATQDTTGANTSSLTTHPDDAKTAYALGLLEETPEEKAFADTLLTFSANGGSALPSSFDNSDDYPVPGNQLSMGGCTSWSCVYALKSYQEKQEHQWEYSEETLFSPLYTYTQLNEGRNQGTSIQKTMAILVEQGACTLKDFPYQEYAYSPPPDNSQRQNAAAHKSKEFFTVRGENDFKTAIYNYGGIVIGVEVFDDFENINSTTNTVYDDLSGTADGMHAICLVGWDDSIEAFKFINSWGADWGDGGFAWISYDIATAYGYGYALKMDTQPTEEVYTVRFDRNGGTGSMNSVDVDVNSRFLIPSGLFTNENHRFLGWMVYSEHYNEYLHYNPKSGYSYKSEEMSIQVIVKDASTWTNLTVSGDTLTFRAVWDSTTIPAEEYTIKFNPNGGSGTMASFAVPSGSLTVPENQYHREGYVFDGWYAYIQSTDESRHHKYVYENETSYTLFFADENDAGWYPSIFYENQKISQIAYSGESMVFVARWKETTNNSGTYTISFESNGGTGSMQSLIVEPGNIHIPTNAFSMDGHTFDGWFVYIVSNDKSRHHKFVYKKGNEYTLFVANENDPDWYPVVFSDNQEIPQLAHGGETLVFRARWKES